MQGSRERLAASVMLIVAVFWWADFQQYREHTN
jgi:hypothetical protein